MILRRVDGDDFGSIYGLVQYLGDPSPFADLKCLLEGLLEDPQRELVLVVDDEDRAVGLMCLHQGPGKGGCGFQVTIQELMIRPGYHRQDIDSG